MATSCWRCCSCSGFWPPPSIKTQACKNFGPQLVLCLFVLTPFCAYSMPASISILIFGGSCQANTDCFWKCFPATLGYLYFYLQYLYSFEWVAVAHKHWEKNSFRVSLKQIWKLMPESNGLIVTADSMGGVAQIWFWGLTDFFFF